MYIFIQKERMMQPDGFRLGIFNGNHSDEEFEIVLIEGADRNRMEMRRRVLEMEPGRCPPNRFFQIDQIATIQHRLHQAEYFSRS